MTLRSTLQSYKNSKDLLLKNNENLFSSKRQTAQKNLIFFGQESWKRSSTTCLIEHFYTTLVIGE